MLTMSGELMALKFLTKINWKLKLLYKKNSYLTLGPRRILCAALIHSNFNYALRHA